MKVLNSDMELVTLIFLISETILLLYQLLFYYQSSYDKKKGNYLTLLALFVVYNLFGGLFPDHNSDVPIVLQNILAYGSGFALGCFLPYYFYKTYHLESIKFHVFYGVTVFLILPFFGFIVLEYTVTGNIDLAVKHGVVIPAIYAVIVMYLIYRAIKKKIATTKAK